MQLRSGHLVGDPKGSIAPSKVPTQGSSTPSVGNLEQIVESTSDSQSESISQTNSVASMDQEGHSPMFVTSTSKSTNPFEATTIGLDLDVQLRYVYTNAQGAEIFKDPKNHYTVKIADMLSTLDKAPWVNDQGGSYMGKDGARYILTIEPELVDRLGYTSSSGAMGHTLPTASQELPSTSKNPKVPLGDFFEELTLGTDKKGKGKLEENPREEHWKVVRERWVTKVIQDDPLKVVYKDAFEAYYSTTRLPNVELPLSHFLMVERLSELIHRVCDRYGNEYRTMD